MGRRIRQARERRRLSQEELAGAIGKDQRSISEYENGRQRLAVVDLPELAAALDVPVRYFFEDEDAPTDLDEVLLEYFHQLSSRDAQLVAVHIVRVLAEAPTELP